MEFTEKSPALIRRPFSAASKGDNFLYHFIVNLTAGKGKTKKAVEQIEEYLKEKGVPYAMHESRYPGNAIELARSLSAENVNIVAVGGDGTFNEILNGIDIEKAVLGFIPAGVGNDFARTAGMSGKPLEALEDILKGRIVNADYINVGSEENMRRCLNVAGTGLDIDVLQRFDRKNGKTKLQYYTSLVASLFKFKGYDIEMTLDGETTSHNAFLAVAANGQYFGGGMKVSPDSDIYDGKLDVVLIHMTKRRKIPGMLIKFLQGKHLGLAVTKAYKADSVRIKCLQNDFVDIDGELLRGLDFTASVVPGGLKMFAPSSKEVL